jgi:hypothetical protein
MAYRTLYLLYALLLFPICSSATRPDHQSAIQVDIVSDDGRIYPVYDVDMQARGTTHRAWLEAVYGQNYAIRIYNNSSRRIGLVIAVDGRNIISGQKSNLAYTERMYILGPWQSASYDGWRSSNRKINQFFFTDAKDSYAGAWQDHSAMGVIALAAFNEKKQYRPRNKKYAPQAMGRSDMPTEAESSADRLEESRIYKEKNRQAGTGFGEEKYSYARVVAFKPMTVAREKVFYKYEWRQSLCQWGIIACSPHGPNRFWPEHDEYYGYAPYPPR